MLSAPTVIDGNESLGVCLCYNMSHAVPISHGSNVFQLSSAVFQASVVVAVTRRLFF